MARRSPLPACDDPAPDSAAGARALVERQMARLERLAEIGMEIAEAAGRRAARLAEDAGEARADAPDPGLSFARAARAVRLTIALQSRLAAELAGLGRAEAHARAARGAVARRRLHRRLERVIDETQADTDEAERLSSDAWECLRDWEDEDLLARPVAEVMARICADLGLPPGPFLAAAGGPCGDGGEAETGAAAPAGPGGKRRRAQGPAPPIPWRPNLAPAPVGDACAVGDGAGFG